MLCYLEKVQNEMSGVDEKESSKISLLYIIAFLFYAIVALLANELSLGYNGVYLAKDYLYYGYGSAIISTLVGIFLIVLFTKKLGMKHNYFFFGVCLLSFIGNMVALLSFPNKLEIDDSFYFLSPIGFRVYLIFSFLSLSIFIYVLYSFMPLLKKGKRSFAFIFELIICTALIAIFASYYLDFNDYVILFKRIHDQESFISSFLGHKNVFGLLLLFATMSEVYLFEIDGSKWRIIPTLYLLASTFLINAKSSLLAEMVLILAYFIYKGIRLFKSKRGISITLLSIVGLCFIAGITIISLPVPSKDGLLKGLILSCKSIFNNGEGSTIGARYVIYQKLFNQLNMSPMYWIFGFGDTNFQYSFFYAADSSSPDAPPFNSWPSHNGFLECLARGGTIRLVIYGCVLIYLAYRFIKKFKKEKDPSIFTSLVYFAPFLVRTMVEYEYLFLDGWKGAVFAFFIITPILENKEEVECSYSFFMLKEIFAKEYSYLLAIIGSSLLSYSFISLNVYSLSICLPLSALLLGLFFWIKYRQDKNLTIWVSSFCLIFNLSISLTFGLIGNMPLWGICFSFAFGAFLPIAGLLSYKAFLMFYKRENSLVIQ